MWEKYFEFNWNEPLKRKIVSLDWLLMDREECLFAGKSSKGRAWKQYTCNESSQNFKKNSFWICGIHNE